uniref:Uncharacterized protein n=1 Tax=viral metagenome TaxID=1070528 RepID=A0A6C0C5K1_9ZZZZ
MNFSKESTDLMGFFFNSFHKVASNKGANKQRTTDNLLLMIYDDITVSSRMIDMVINDDSFIKKIYNVNNNTVLPSTSLFTSAFVPETIKSGVYNIKKYIEIRCKIFNKKITIYLFIYNDEDMNIYDLYIKKILIVVRILLLYSNEKSGSLSIYLYLSEEKKYLPSNPLSILDKKNCNSAVTTACDNTGSILIFRKEEWLKVLIHEIFHNFCLDLNGINHDNIKARLLNLFKIKSEMEISEAYSEFWGEIMNCCICAYYLLDNPCDKKSFLLYSEFCIEFERTFSFFQVIKILDFMGLNYGELISNNDENIYLKSTLYREKTNVFTYYVLKMVLLYDYDDFLNWCCTNNNLMLKFKKTPKNVMGYYDYIVSKYKKSGLVRTVVCDEELMKLYKNLKNGYKFPYKDKIIKTLRMSICELN